MSAKKILVIAPHPDDETLGVGGTLLNHKTCGDEIHWLIMTRATVEAGFSDDFIRKRNAQIEQVSSFYGFASKIQLPFVTTMLDTRSSREIVEQLSKALSEVKPEILYIPHRGDVHSDHRVTFEAVASATKWFRFSSVKRILAYETLSETGFSLGSTNGFHPNVFVDISRHLEKKLVALKIYEGETGNFPFPRSEEALRSLAAVRGATSGFKAAEAFVLLREFC